MCSCNHLPSFFFPPANLLIETCPWSFVLLLSESVSGTTYNPNFKMSWLSFDPFYKAIVTQHLLFSSKNINISGWFDNFPSKRLLSFDLKWWWSYLLIALWNQNLYLPSCLFKPWQSWQSSMAQLCLKVATVSSVFNARENIACTFVYRLYFL